MKLYDWKCKACKYVYEAEECFPCPRCGSADVYRLYRMAVHFHGDGFYATSNRQDEPKEDADSP